MYNFHCILISRPKHCPPCDSSDSSAGQLAKRNELSDGSWLFWFNMSLESAHRRWIPVCPSEPVDWTSEPIEWSAPFLTILQHIPGEAWVTIVWRQQGFTPVIHTSDHIAVDRSPNAINGATLCTQQVVLKPVAAGYRFWQLTKLSLVWLIQSFSNSNWPKRRPVIGLVTVRRPLLLWNRAERSAKLSKEKKIKIGIDMLNDFSGPFSWVVMGRWRVGLPVQIGGRFLARKIYFANSI